MNNDIFKFGKKLNPLRYYLLFYIVIALLVIFVDAKIIDKGSSLSMIGYFVFILSLSILPLLATVNCFIYKYNFWRTFLEFLLCFAVLISMGTGLIGMEFLRTVKIDSFGDFWGGVLLGLSCIAPISIPVSIIVSIIVWLVKRRMSKKNEPSDALE